MPESSVEGAGLWAGDRAQQRRERTRKNSDFDPFCDFAIYRENFPSPLIKMKATLKLRINGRFTLVAPPVV